MATRVTAIRETVGTLRRRVRDSDTLNSDFVRSIHFWLPPLLLMTLAVYGLLFWNFVISLTDFRGFRLPTYELGALDAEMYARAVADPAFWTATRNTLALVIAFTGACLVVGLALAILIDRAPRRHQGPFRTIYLLPFSLSFVVTAIYWLWVYNFEDGIINAFFRAIGADFLALHWLSHPQLKLGSVAFALIWQFSGYAMVVYLAGLQTIPEDQYEASKVDGASTLTMYRKVIIPQLRASALAVAVILMVFGLRAFGFLFVMFGINPGKPADILATMMYRVAFGGNQWAYGAAIGSILFVLSIAVLTPYLYLQYQRGEL